MSDSDKLVNWSLKTQADVWSKVNWSSFVVLIFLSFFSIIAQDCTNPVGGPNMNLKDDDILLQAFPDGIKVTFVCDIGYISAGGSGVITCKAGEWSPIMLKCESKY